MEQRNPQRNRTVVQHSPSRAMSMTSTDFEDPALKSAQLSEFRTNVTARDGHLAQTSHSVFRGAHGSLQPR